MRHKSQIENHKLTLHLIRRNPLTVFALLTTGLIVLIALFPQYFATYPERDIYTIHLNEKLTPPCGEHLFGTDELGRDIFTKVIYGARLSFFIAFSVIGIGVIIGVPLGIIAGYSGGKIGEIIMRVTDIFMAIPPVLMALAITAALSPNVNNAILALGFVWWRTFTRLIRGKVLSIREQGYVSAAKAIGASNKRIMFHHILPNCISVLIVHSTTGAAGAILTAGTLGFLGLGAQPPTPEWGTMVGAGRQFMPTYWWVSTFPGLAMFITALALCLLGDGLRDVLDPRLRY